MEYLYSELVIFFLFYGILGWIAEVVTAAVVYHRFSNRGFFNLPICPKYGIMADILVVVLPTVGEELSIGNAIEQYVITLVVVAVVDFITGESSRRLLHRRFAQYERENLFGGEKKGLVVAIVKSMAVLVVIKLIHPFVFVAVKLTPIIVLRIVGLAGLIILFADMITVIYAGKKLQSRLARGMREERLGNKLCNGIWKRLEHAYPGMLEELKEDDSQAENEESSIKEKYVFAKGLCLNKLIWVFVIWALCGDLIETVFVALTSGVWMSRSSLIYGPFSIVWGFGAIIITIVTQRLANREDRYIFLSGCVLWGVYEYTCSVISEVVFGRTFWDYSDMTFNIGGRTNLLFCVFGGALSVLWVKVIYPVISRWIEKIPPAIGMVATWVLVVLMVADLALSGAVLARYVERTEGEEATNVFEEFIDQNYSDSYVESVWPNMRVPGGVTLQQEKESSDQ